MADHVGWRNFWWLNVALLVLALIMTATMFPETKWHRIHPTELGQALSSGSSPRQDSNEVAQKAVKYELSTHEDMADVARTETAERDPSLGRGSPSKQQFKPAQPKDQRTSLWNEIVTPWKLMAFPIVELASFIVSWSASCFLTLNLTQAQNFAAPPYLYSSEVIGASAI